LEAYFASSEQLPTRVLLAADEQRAAGLLVQKLPGAAAEELEEGVTSAWDDAQQGIERINPAQLLEVPAEAVLAQAFPANDLRLFRGSRVQFECRCSLGRVAGVLKALGAEEIRDLLREQGSVTVTCEFCQRPYRFDSIDIEALFAEGPATGDSPAVH
jgi:molecular chaperone Hsp33